MSRRSEWQRVSPVAIVYFLLKAIANLVNLWPALIGIWAAGETARYYSLFYGVPMLLLVTVASVVVQYWFFRFRVDDDRIQMRTGALNRKRLTLEFDRVQQADIAQPFYFRPFNLTILGLESAGSKQQEVDIPGLPSSEAEGLRSRILEHIARAKDATETTGRTAESEPHEADYRLCLPPRELLRYGLMQNTLLFLAPLAAPFGQNLGPLLEQWIKSLEQTAFVQTLDFLTTEDLVWVAVVLGVLAAVAGAIFLFALSAVLALVHYWGYDLTRRGDRFQYRAGLTTVRTRGFRLHKLQKVTVAQGIVARLLKRYSVFISKAGGFETAAQDKQRFTIPVVTDEALADLQSQLSLPPVNWLRVHRFYIVLGLLTGGTITAVIAAYGLTATDATPWPALLAYPLVAAIVWRRWRCFGYRLDDQWLAVKNGFIGRKVHWVPVGKVQKVGISEPPLLKPLGLANLHVWSAGGKLTVPCIPTGTADRLRDLTLFYVVTYARPWF